MKKWVLLICLTTITVGFGRSFRVNQIPNGSQFGCLNCHNGQGGSRNAFGLEIYNNYLSAKNSSGNVLWGAALAMGDADEDGASNGEELGDPNGNWMVGSADPGDPALVSNPGDPTSTTLIPVFTLRAPQQFELFQNYPNPFNPATLIDFAIAKKEMARLVIFNSMGQAVKTLVNETLTPGRYQVTWDGTNETGNLMPSGIYWYRIETETWQKSMRMIMVK